MKSPQVMDTDRRYTIAICKASAAVEEMRKLLHTWEPGTSAKDLSDKVQHEGVLGKQTAYRTKDLVNRVFRPRMLLPDDRAARALKRYIEGQGAASTFRELLFLHHGRSDALLFDFTVLRYWPMALSGALVVSIEDVLAFFDDAEQRGRIADPWSSQVQLKVARGVLGALREYGLIREVTRRRREIVPYRMSDQAVAYLAHDLHFRDVPDSFVVAHEDWALYGLGPDQALDRLEGIAPKMGMAVQRGGSLVRISWNHPSMESLVDDIAR